MSTAENTSLNQDTLYNFNKEYMETLNDLKDKKELDIIQSTLDENNVKKTVLEETIDKKNKQLKILETTIKDIQSAYEKIVETSQVLLTVIKQHKRKV
jgi:hypothetical protein